SEAVRAEVLGDETPLGNSIAGVGIGASAAATGLERVADVPIYFADPLVRRAPSLQKTKDAAAPVARMSSSTLADLKVSSGDRVRVCGSGRVELTAVADDTVAEGCVRIAAAHASTVALGPMCGELSVERV
ncbi:MAG: molybdopterin dinucleotide binding domain-containing protein, partial [Azoarcus sp.]|nr:molybdopterin dinucleotide binding domain-containing protein [Azoarcus sp.]